MQTIQALPSRHAGCLFRSRLEARWAVFFDALGIKWEYEPEGYRLSNGECYLPDFWLPESPAPGGPGLFAEVKPRVPSNESATSRYPKTAQLAADTGKSAVILEGPPDLQVHIYEGFWNPSDGPEEICFDVFDLVGNVSAARIRRAVALSKSARFGT